MNGDLAQQAKSLLGVVAVGRGFEPQSHVELFSGSLCNPLPSIACFVVQQSGK
jgi:hypothetical protein